MANQSKLQEEVSDQKEKTKVLRKKHCVSPSCSYFHPDGLFGFPKNDFMKKKWLTALGLTEPEVKNDSKVCQHHFHWSHIHERSKSTQRLRLKIGAYPTMNLTKVSKQGHLIGY